MNIDPTKLARVRRLTNSGSAKAIRVSAGLSLAEMGAGVGEGVRPSTILRWERGDRSPRGEMALHYLELLDRLAVQ